MTTRSGRRAATIIVAVAALIAGGAAVGSVVDAERTNAAVLASTVENEGANCAVPALPDAGSLPTNARLPDPFRRLDNSRITTTGDWRCRREEIKRLAEKFVYGEKPAKPQTVTGTVSSSSITVNVSHNGRSSSFSAGVQLPSGSGPFPAVVVLGGSAPTRPRSGRPARPSSTTTRTPSAARARRATTSRARSTASTATPARPVC